MGGGFERGNEDLEQMLVVVFVVCEGGRRMGMGFMGMNGQGEVG